MRSYPAFDSPTAALSDPDPDIACPLPIRRCAYSRSTDISGIIQERPYSRYSHAQAPAIVHIHLVRHRAHLLQQPARVVSLIGLQLVIFGLHSLALLSILYSLDVTISPMAVIAAYGITLIVSSFTILPGGGGAVETTLAVALSIQGVAIEVAVGAAVLFRLLSFWLLLPLGFVCYRWLLLENQSARQ